MPTGVLFGQIAVVLGVALAGVWAATQWTAAALGYQARLGLPWFELFGTPIYRERLVVPPCVTAIGA